jgi:hypothetical protein
MTSNIKVSAVLAATMGLAASLVVTAPAHADTAMTDSCVDGGGTTWTGHSIWGDDYTGGGVKLARNRVAGVTSSSPTATTVDYSIRTYDGDGKLVQVMGEQDRAFDFAGGSRFLDRNPANPPSSPGKAKVVINVGNGDDGSDNCSITFTQPGVGQTPPPPQTPPPTPTATTVTKVLTIVEENKTVEQMKTQMPYTYGLTSRYAISDNFKAIRYHSEPNYLAIAGGDTFGVDNDDEPPSNTQTAPSVFGQALSVGKTAKTYAESMPSNCTTSGDVDKGYAVKHNPWVFFLTERSDCARYDVPAGGAETGAFITDAENNRLPNVGLLVPNKCNDAHDTGLGCDLATADEWLSKRLPAVLASDDFTSGRLMVVVTADEDDGSDGNRIFTAFVQAGLRDQHLTPKAHLTHYSLSKLYSEVTCTKPLRKAAKARSILPVLGLNTRCS